MPACDWRITGGNMGPRCIWQICFLVVFLLCCCLVVLCCFPSFASLVTRGPSISDWNRKGWSNSSGIKGCVWLLARKEEGRGFNCMSERYGEGKRSKQDRVKDGGSEWGEEEETLPVSSCCQGSARWEPRDPKVLRGRKRQRAVEMLWKMASCQVEHRRGSWTLNVLPWPQRICVRECTHKDTWPWRKAQLRPCTYKPAHAYTRAVNANLRTYETRWSRKKSFSPGFCCLQLFISLIHVLLSFSHNLVFFEHPCSLGPGLPPPFRSAVLPLIYACCPVPA